MIYSLIVNGPMVGIEGIICIVILAALPVDRIMYTSSNNTVSVNYLNKIIKSNMYVVLRKIN